MKQVLGDVMQRQGWALKWRSENHSEGKRSHLMMSHFGINVKWYETINVGLFPTRQAAKDFNKAHYGYIKECEDLRAEPHGWKMPQVVKATLSLIEID